MEDNTHTSKQAYVRQPHPSQTTHKPHETKRPQPTRLHETKVPCGAAYIIWPRKAVSLNICAANIVRLPNQTPFLPTMPRRETQRHTAKLLRTAPHYTKDDISQLDHFSFRLLARPVHDFYIAVSILQRCAFETPHNSAFVSIRIVQVGVSAQG